MRKEPWIVPTRRLVAKFFQTTDREVGRWIEDGMPRVPALEGKHSYDLSSITLWLRERDRAAILEEALGDAEAEGGDSAWLEECRKQRARKFKVDADRAERLVVDREEARMHFSQFSEIMRKTCEILRRSSPEAHRLVDSALEEAEAALASLVRPPSEDPS